MRPENLLIDAKRRRKRWSEAGGDLGYLSGLTGLVNKWTGEENKTDSQNRQKHNVLSFSWFCNSHHLQAYQLLYWHLALYSFNRYKW